MWVAISRRNVCHSLNTWTLPRTTRCRDAGMKRSIRRHHRWKRGNDKRLRFNDGPSQKWHRNNTYDFSLCVRFVEHRCNTHKQQMCPFDGCTNTASRADSPDKQGYSRRSRHLVIKMEVQIVDYNLACVYAYIKGVNDLEHLLMSGWGKTPM